MAKHKIFSDHQLPALSNYSPIINCLLFVKMQVHLIQQLMQPQLQQYYMQKPMHLAEHSPNFQNQSLSDDEVRLNNRDATLIPVESN